MPHQVFISYASEDRSTADRVCRALENTGVTCWMAPRDIPPGTDYPAAIMDGIQQASVLVLLLTDAAVQSPHILSEVGHAFNGKKRIVPFRLSSVTLPPDLEYFLSMTQWLDAEDGPTGANLKQLIGAVRAAVYAERPPAAARRRRRWKWVAVSAAAMVLMGAGGVAYRLRGTKPPPKPAAESPVPISTAPEPAPVKTAPAVKTPVVWTNPADGAAYVWIPPGNFVMGCSAGDGDCGPDEKPAHPVKIADGFWMARTEVTVKAYRAYAAHKGLEAFQGKPDLPVTGVTWSEAKQYCAAVGGRLPAEAEWEYAARAGTAQAYYGDPQDIGWYVDNSGDELQPVQKKAPNGFGLYDMLGNAAEWVLDRYYNKYYLDSPATGPKVEQPLAGNASGTVRGGFFGGDVGALRLSRRVATPPDEPSQAIGFRCIAGHRAP